MISFIGWLADRGVDQATWNGMSPGMQNSIKAEYEALVPANQREFDLGAGFENIDPAETVVTTTTEGEELTDLDKALADLQARAQAFQEQKAAEAQRLGARDVGKFSTDIRRALLATGRSAGEIEQLSAAGIEGGARSLNDLLQQLSLQGQQTQLAIGEFGIGAQLTQEDINARLLMASQELSLGERRLEEGIRQFDVTQRNRPSPFQGLFAGLGTGLGFAVGGPLGAGIGNFVGGLFGRGSRPGSPVPPSFG